MIEAFAIAANLSLTGNAKKEMTEFAAIVEKASRNMAVLNKLMQSMDGTYASLGSIMDEVNASFMSFNRITDRTIEKNSVLTRSYHSVAAASRELSRSVGLSEVSHGIGGVYAGRTLMGMGPAGWAISGGLALGGLTYSGFEATKEYNQNIGQLRARGLTDSQINQVKSMTATSRAGVSQNRQVTAFNDAMMATQNFGMASGLFQTLATAEYASGLYGGLSKNDVQNAIRVAEIRGGSDPHRIAEELGMVFKIQALSGGSIKPTEIRTFLRRATLAGFKLSDQGILALEPVMQELGGSALGTAITTARTQLIGGKGMAGINKASVQEMQRFGILNKPMYDSTGRPVGSKYGSLSARGSALLQADPNLFLRDFLLPLYAKQGITSEDSVLQHITFEFGRTTANAFGLMLKNMQKTDRERASLGGVQGINGQAAIFQKTEGGASARLSQAWLSFTKSWGDMTSPGVILGMNIFSSVLEKLANIFGSWASQKDRTLGGQLLSGSTQHISWLSPSNTKPSPVVSNHSAKQVVHTTTVVKLHEHTIATAFSRGIAAAHNWIDDQGTSLTNNAAFGHSGAATHYPGS